MRSLISEVPLYDTFVVGGAVERQNGQGPLLRVQGLGLWKEQLLRRNVKRFRGGLVCKAHRRVYHSTLGLRVIKKKKEQLVGTGHPAPIQILPFPTR